MPDEPTPPPLPRPVIPIDESAADAGPSRADVPEAPVAPAYHPPADPSAGSGPRSAYPPPVPGAQGTGYPPPAVYPPAGAYPPPAAYPPVWPGPQTDYRTGASGYGRPAFVTTLGVFAIITAAVSFLASAFTGCSSMVLLGQAQRGAMTMRTGRAATTTMPAVPPAVVTPASPDGMSAGDARVVMNVFRSRRRLTPERQRQLEAFLRENGKLLLDEPSGALTSRKVFEHLGETGQEFASPGRTGADFFVIKAGPLARMPGRLRVFDDRSVFEADDHSTTLRSAAAAAKEPQANPAEESLDPGLDADGAAAVVNQIRAESKNLLNPAQAATLTSTLQSPAYSAWVTPSSTVPGLTAQVRSVVVKGDGSVTVTFTMAKVTLDRQGQIVGGAPGGAGATTTQPGGGATLAFGTIAVNKSKCTLAIVEALLSVLLAVFLLVTAILSLRQSPVARRLYLVYAVAKLLCGVMAIVAFAGILRTLNAGNDQYGYAQAVATGFGGVARVALTFSVIGLVFPLVVLGALTLSRTVKDYYRAGGASSY